MKKLLVPILISLFTLPLITLAQSDEEREKLKEEIRMEMLKEELRKEIEQEMAEEKKKEELKEEMKQLENEKEALKEEIKEEMKEKEEREEKVEELELESASEMTVEEVMAKGAEVQAEWDIKKAEAVQRRIDTMDYILNLPVQDPDLVVYDTIQVRQINGKTSQGPAQGFQLFVRAAKEKDVANGWKRFLKAYKAKMDSKNRDDEYFVDDASIPTISNLNMDLTSTMQEVNGNLVMTTYFDMGGIYLNESKNPTAAASAKKMLRTFGVEMQKEVIEEQLKDDEKEQEKLEKDLDQLRRKQENIQSSIVRMKGQIAEAELEIQQNLNDQDTGVDAIRTQQTEVRKTQMQLNGVE